MCAKRSPRRSGRSDKDHWHLGVQAYLGIGSNVGDRRAWCAKAIARLTSHPDISHLTRSALYETEPVDAPNQGWFLNCAVSVETELTVKALFSLCTRIERDLGRVRFEKNASRTIDLDILLYGTEIIQTDSLVIPHPRMDKRKFVLAPLAELVPELRHPVLRLTIQQLLTQLTEPHIVRKL